MVIRLKGKCDERRFHTRIVTAIKKVCDDEEEYLIVERPSSDVVFIQMYAISPDELHVEVWGMKAVYGVRFVKMKDGIDIFRQVCVLRKDVKAVDYHGYNVIDIMRLINCEFIEKRFRCGVDNPDDEAIYIEVLQERKEKYFFSGCYERLAEYYKKIGDYDLAEKYKRLERGGRPE